MNLLYQMSHLYMKKEQIPIEKCCGNWRYNTVYPTLPWWILLKGLGQVKRIELMSKVLTEALQTVSCTYLFIHNCKILLSRDHYLLALITNGTSRAQWEKIDRLDLRCYFDSILVSGDLPWEKPDQKIFHECCQFLGVEPRHCIMVGDKLETDIQVIQQSNIKHHYCPAHSPSLGSTKS